MNSNLDLVLKIKTAKKLCIGSGGLALKTKADITFLRISNKLLIPASTIKGILRTSMIRVAPLLCHDINDSIYPNKIKGDDIVASLMGKPNRLGKVRVSPALLADDTFTLTHVTIDDKTRIAEEGSLFSIEYLPKDIEFTSTIKAWNVNEEEAKILFAGIAEMNYERFGRGGGLVKVNIASDSYIPEQFRDDDIISTILEVIM